MDVENRPNHLQEGGGHILRGATELTVQKQPRQRRPQQLACRAGPIVPQVLLIPTQAGSWELPHTLTRQFFFFFFHLTESLFLPFATKSIH